VPGNVLFITADQWRGDSLSALGHPVVRTPNLDALCASGVLFANHWAVTAPCGPSRASLYTGTYLHHHRSVLNGTPLDARFTNVALEARRCGYDPVLFGYTDASVDPRTVPEGDPSLFSYEGVLPGFRPIVHDPFEAGSLEWGKWLAARGRDVPSNPHRLYEPDLSYPGASDHAFTWAPGHFSAEETETAFMTEQVISYLEREARDPFFVHLSYLRPHPPYRNPPGYHDLYSLDDVAPFDAHPTRTAEQAVHPLLDALARFPGVGAAADERERRQLRATYHGMQAEVDAQLGRLFGWLESAGLADDTLVVFTSDHGELGGDHWCIGKGGWFDASFRVPLIVRDPRPCADSGRGRIVDAPTEAVDVMPTILEWIGVEVPLQVDGWSLRWAIEGREAPEHWRSAAHMEWDFRNPSRLLAERRWGLPSAHCVLTVLRSDVAKYVQFAADASVLPPLFFDLDEDPGELHDVAPDPERREDCYIAARELLQWRMREDDRELANSILTSDRGLVRVRDHWR
jgi:arylsulfatase A-like enzyme